MRKIFLFVLILFFAFPITIAAQSFEGKITYKNTYKSKIPNVTDDQLESMMGNLQEYFVKDGNFKSVTNGLFVQWQLYIQKDNKLYNKLSSSESLFWIDASVTSDTIIKSIVQKDVIEILGYRCDELLLVGKAGTQKYYFNSKLSVDPALYANFKFGNWSDFISQSKALPLKMILETSQLTLESIALEVNPSILDAAMFLLPADAVLEKSPY